MPGTRSQEARERRRKKKLLREHNRSLGYRRDAINSIDLKYLDIDEARYVWEIIYGKRPD